MRIEGKQCKGKTKHGYRCTKLIAWCALDNYCSIHKSQEAKKKEAKKAKEASINGKEGI